MKKNIIWIFFWTVINIVLSMSYQYIKTMPHNHNATHLLSLFVGFADTINFLIRAPILGLIGSPLFLMLDYHYFREQFENKKMLLIGRILVILVLIFIIDFIDERFF